MAVIVVWTDFGIRECEFWRHGRAQGWREGECSSHLLDRRRRQGERVGWRGADGRRDGSGGRGVQSEREGVVALYDYVREVDCSIIRGAGGLELRGWLVQMFSNV